MADVVETIIAAGYGVETFLSDYNFTPLTPEGLARLREMCTRASIVTAHTSTYIWNPDSILREISLVKSIGGRILVVHPGTFGFEKCDNPPTVATIQDICKHAIDNGIYLALENGGRTGMAMMERALDMIGADPDTTGLGICIDTGHANRSACIDGYYAEDYISRFRDLIIELHINDNHGDEDLHLPPGQGTINWSAVFDASRQLSRDVVVCLELAGGEGIDPLGALAQSRGFVAAGLRV